MTPDVHLAVALVTAHFLGDFVLQSKGMAARKRNPSVLAMHVIIVATLSYGLAGAWTNWKIPVFIFTTHAIIDSIKARWGRNGPSTFVVDQLAHLVAIAVLVWWLDLTPVAFHWVNRFGDGATNVLAVTGATVLATKVAGIFIEKVIQPFQSHEIRDRGLLAGGVTIGRLERFLILVFVMINELGAIGFLIAAKSILRFGELREHRREAEYVIIGTMWSFACGLMVALVARWVLRL